MRVQLSKTYAVTIPQRAPIVVAVVILAVYNIYMAQQIPRKLAIRRAGHGRGVPSHDDFLGSFDINDLPTLTLPEGRGVPSVCQRAEQECKRVGYCNKRKWQDIPSCHRASKRCSELPITDQIAVGYCEPCLDMGRDIKFCHGDITQCYGTREICLKVRKKVRESSCPASREYLAKWSVAGLKEYISMDTEHLSQQCLDSVRSEIDAYNAFRRMEGLAFNKKELEAREKAAEKARRDKAAAAAAAAKASAAGKHSQQQQMHFSGLDGGGAHQKVDDHEEMEKISYPKLDLDLS